MVSRVLHRLRELGVPLVRLDQILDGVLGRANLPPLSVCFTLDDGYLDQAEQLVPVLLEHGISPTLFVITGFLDGQLWPWDAQAREFFRGCSQRSLEIRVGDRCLKYDTSTEDSQRALLLSALAAAVGAAAGAPVPSHHRPMSWHRARELERLGVQFGSHSVSHCVFSRVPTEKATSELQVSRRRIIEELQRPSPVLAWPIGRQVDFSERDLKIACAVGYAATVDLTSRDVISPSGMRADVPIILHRHGFPDSEAEVLRTTFGLTMEAAVDAVRYLFGRSGPGKGQLKSSLQRGSDTGSPGTVLMKSAPPSPIVWERVGRLVFVCKGNICRSPYAEHRARALGFSAVSCGIHANPGTRADEEATRNASFRNIDLSTHRSRRLDELELTPADLVVYMESSQRSAVIPFVRESGAQDTLAASWASGASRHGAIHDPFGRDDVDFQAAFEMLDEAISNLAARMPAGLDSPGSRATTS